MQIFFANQLHVASGRVYNYANYAVSLLSRAMGTDSPKALQRKVRSEDFGRNAQDFLASVARPSCLQTQALAIPTQNNPPRSKIIPSPANGI